MQYADQCHSNIPHGVTKETAYGTHGIPTELEIMVGFGVMMVSFTRDVCNLSNKNQNHVLFASCLIFYKFSVNIYENLEDSHK